MAKRALDQISAELLVSELADLRRDPLKFVMWAFPWGEEGELETFAGPEPWQRKVLEHIRDNLATDPYRAIRYAVTSGHGIGKSALVAWLILWAISTSETLGVVTANTERQLKTKTWATLSRWHRLFIGKDLFVFTATSIYYNDPAYEKDWRIDMVPWSDKNTEAFAGLHNKGKRVLVIFDEGSAIPDQIYEVANGALTDTQTEILWFVAGNPTLNTGYFRECFDGKFSHRWTTQCVDSRSVSIANHELIQEWIEDYGEDSDFVRVRVKGQFPRTSTEQFIPTDIVNAAMSRDPEAFADDPTVVGVDVARFGADQSVIYTRKGYDGKSFPVLRFQGLDTMELVAQVSTHADLHRPDAIFVDATGVGGGVADRLRQLRLPVFDVQFGAKPDGITAEEDRYANKRAEIWGAMRNWLRIGSIPKDDDFQKQLIGPSYGFNAQNAIQLERKDDMKKRGLPSPDIADALALTFAFPIWKKGTERQSTKSPMSIWDYDPFAEAA